MTFRGLLLFAPLLASCGSNSAAPTSFRSDVVPILTASCAGSGVCHGTPGGAEIYLAAPVGSASATIALLVNRPSVELPSMPLVTPGAPDASYLVHKLDGDFGALAGCDEGEDGGPCGVTMPKGNGMLSEAERGVIRSWISAGAADN